MSAKDLTTLPVVYFILFGDCGPIKIGLTVKGARRRILAMQTGSPEPLRLLGTIPVGEHTEASLHRRFAHLRVRGEWFDAAPELLRFIHDNAELEDESSPVLDLNPPPESVSPRKRRGRRDVTTLPEERERHIGVALARIAHGFTAAETAKAFGVSIRTVQHWVAFALSYDDPRSRALRARLEKTKKPAKPAPARKRKRKRTTPRG